MTLFPYISGMSQHKIDRQAVGEMIRKIRKTKGMSQTDLAKLLGINYQTILNIEKGQNFKLQLLEEISAHLECPLNELLGFTSNNDLSPITLTTSRRMNKLSSGYQKVVLQIVKGLERGLDDETIDQDVLS